MSSSCELAIIREMKKSPTGHKWSQTDIINAVLVYDESTVRRALKKSTAVVREKDGRYTLKREVK